VKTRSTAALKALRSIRPREASLRFAEAVDAIQRGRINGVFKSITGSEAKLARPMIIATNAVASDADFERLLGLYVKLNSEEAAAEQQESANLKATELAHVIRRLTNPKGIAALRKMFPRIELEQSARDIVVAVLANGDVDDVTTVLLKIANFPKTMFYQNHVELCLAAKRSLMKSSRGIPDKFATWMKSRNFWSYIHAKEMRSISADDLLPLDNQANRSLFIRLLAYAILGLVRSSDDELLHLLIRHRFTTISSAAAVRISELLGEEALNAISAEVDDAISAGRAGALASAICSAEESLYLRL
jgi:hypothetical protein